MSAGHGILTDIGGRSRIVVLTNGHLFGEITTEEREWYVVHRRPHIRSLSFAPDRFSPQLNHRFLRFCWRLPIQVYRLLVFWSVVKARLHFVTDDGTAPTVVLRQISSRESMADARKRRKADAASQYTPAGLLRHSVSGTSCRCSPGWAHHLIGSLRNIQPSVDDALTSEPSRRATSKMPSSSVHQRRGLSSAWEHHAAAIVISADDARIT